MTKVIIKVLKEFLQRIKGEMKSNLTFLEALFHWKHACHQRAMTSCFLTLTLLDGFVLLFEIGKTKLFFKPLVHYVSIISILVILFISKNKTPRFLFVWRFFPKARNLAQKLLKKWYQRVWEVVLNLHSAIHRAVI